MKNCIKTFILTSFLFLSGVTFAQDTKEDIDLVVGISTPELIHGGIRFHYMPTARLDLNFGSDFSEDVNARVYALNINHANYFGKVNRKIKNKLWSFNVGFTFLVEQDTFEKSTVAYSNLFFAREFPITKRIFLQPELGASYFLFEHIVDMNDIKSLGNRTRLIPKFGLNLLFRI